MSYRNITVEDEKYRYVVGATFLKIQKDGREFSVQKVADVCNPIAGSRRHFVSPRTIRNVIESVKRGLQPKPEVLTCKRHGISTTEMTWNPFEREIYGRRIPMINCPSCVENLADDI